MRHFVGLLHIGSQIFNYEAIVYTGADDDTTQVLDSSDHASEDFGP